MSQETRHTDVQEKTQQLLQGPLKHIRAAALAAALLPLASVVATPAAAQSLCMSSGTHGFVFNDVNHDGIQNQGDTPIEGATVYVIGTDLTAITDELGFYYFAVTDQGLQIAVIVPPGKEPAPSNAGGDDTLDSDGVLDGYQSVATVTPFGFANADTDFGFVQTAVQPGTGTPGYWKNHSEAWPPTGITVGKYHYTVQEAIFWLGKVGKDKTATMFSSLVPAILNVGIGNNASCVATTIDAATKWMDTYGPVGSNVPASSYAWTIGEPMHQLMDAYNNGRLCAPHRN